MSRFLQPILAFLFIASLSHASLAAEDRPSPSTPIPDRTLTLEDSVRLALNNSEVILHAREDENIALQRVHESESLFFPKLDLNANWSKFGVEGGVPLLLQPEMGPTLIPNDPHENFYTARASIYQTVYEGGRLRNTWRQARISYERARSVNEAVQTQVAAAAKHAFYDLLLAQEKNRQYVELLQSLDALDKQAPGNWSDTLHMEDELAGLREAAAHASLDEREARLTYLRTLNLELSTNVQLKGKLETQPVDLNLQKLLAWSTQYRSELRQTEYQQELDALGVSLSLAERTPTVGFGALYQRSGTGAPFPTADWAGTLNVNLPISVSDLFFGFSKVREHRAEYRQATLKHAETADQIQMQVRQAFTEYQFWQGELGPREETWHRMEAMLKRLRSETPSLYNRVLGERVRLEARLRYEEAVHGHLTALANLERAVGHSLSAEQ